MSRYGWEDTLGAWRGGGGGSSPSNGASVGSVGPPSPPKDAHGNVTSPSGVSRRGVRNANATMGVAQIAALHQLAATQRKKRKVDRKRGGGLCDVPLVYNTMSPNSTIGGSGTAATHAIMNGTLTSTVTMTGVANTTMNTQQTDADGAGAMPVGGGGTPVSSGSSSMALALRPAPPPPAMPQIDIAGAMAIRSLSSVATAKAAALPLQCVSSHLNALLQVGDVVPALAPLMEKLHRFFKQRVAAPPPPVTPPHTRIVEEAQMRMHTAGRALQDMSLHLAHDLQWKEAMRQRVASDVAATREEIRNLVASIAGDSEDLKDAKEEIAMLQRCIHVMYNELTAAREKMRQTEEPADVVELKAKNLSLAEETYTLSGRCAQQQATIAAMREAQRVKDAEDEVARQRGARHIASLQAKLRSLQREVIVQAQEGRLARETVQEKEREILALHKAGSGGTCGGCTFANLKGCLLGRALSVPNPTDPKRPVVTIPSHAIEQFIEDVEVAAAVAAAATGPRGSVAASGGASEAALKRKDTGATSAASAPGRAAGSVTGGAKSSAVGSRDVVDVTAPYKARLKDLEKTIAKYEKALAWAKRNVVTEVPVAGETSTKTLCHLDPTTYDAFLASDKPVIELLPWGEEETLRELTTLFSNLPAVNCSLSFRSRVDWDPEVKFDVMVLQYITRFKTGVDPDRYGWTLLKKAQAHHHIPLCRLFTMCVRGLPAVLSSKLKVLMENIARTLGEHDENGVGRVSKKAALKVLDRYLKSAKGRILVRQAMMLSKDIATEQQLLYLEACMTDAGELCPFSRHMQHLLLDAYEMVYDALIMCPAHCAVPSMKSPDVMVLGRSATTAFIEKQLLGMLASSGVDKMRPSARQRMLLSILDIGEFVKGVFGRLDSLNASSHISNTVEDQLDDWVRAEDWVPAAINTPLITSDPMVVLPMLLLDRDALQAVGAPVVGGYVAKSAGGTPATNTRGSSRGLTSAADSRFTTSAGSGSGLTVSADSHPAAPLPLLGGRHHVARAAPLAAERE